MDNKTYKLPIATYAVFAVLVALLFYGAKYIDPASIGINIKDQNELSNTAINTAPTSTMNENNEIKPSPAPSEVSGLKIVDVVVGNGLEAKQGMKVSVHYTGTFTDGKKFDSSRDRGQPFEFTLGAGQVIRGWDLGVSGMKVGGKRKLTIQPELGYGPSGIPGAIPGNSTLLFDVELLNVK